MLTMRIGSANLFTYSRVHPMRAAILSVNLLENAAIVVDKNDNGVSL